MTWVTALLITKKFGQPMLPLLGMKFMTSFSGSLLRVMMTKVIQFLQTIRNPIFGGSAWTFDGKKKEFYLHLFCPRQPDINWEAKIVGRQSMKALLSIGQTMEFGFRIDVRSLYSKIPGLPDAPGPGNQVMQHASDETKKLYTSASRHEPAEMFNFSHTDDETSPLFHCNLVPADLKYWKVALAELFRHINGTDY